VGRRDVISAEWKPLVGLLENILARVDEDLGGTVGATITIGHVAHPRRRAPTRLADRGVGAYMVDGQLQRFGGPVPHAIAKAGPVVSRDVWDDPRWPALTREAMTEYAPELAHTWGTIVGSAAVPSGAQDGGVVVLSCALDRPADAETVAVLARYEGLITAALAVAEAGASEGVNGVLEMLQSRTAIEQAKGAMMGVLRCDAERAWAVLRRSSQEFNVKIRDLAVALVEYLGASPAQQPDGGEPIRPDAGARRAAELTWQAVSRVETAGPCDGLPDLPLKGR
jgi:hypothetical protein